MQITFNSIFFITKNKQETFESTKQTSSELPPIKIDFQTFVVSLHTSALIHLGIVDNPLTNKSEKDLPLAKQNIDILEMFEEKTKGNLTDNEKNVLENALYDLRTKYLQHLKNKG